jgi:hypothetical protein
LNNEPRRAVSAAQSTRVLMHNVLRTTSQGDARTESATPRAEARPSHNMDSDCRTVRVATSDNVNASTNNVPAKPAKTVRPHIKNPTPQTATTNHPCRSTCATWRTGRGDFADVNTGDSVGADVSKTVLMDTQRDRARSRGHQGQPPMRPEITPRKSQGRGRGQLKMARAIRSVQKPIRIAR